SAAIPFPHIPATYGNRPTIQHRDPSTGLPSFYKEVAVVAHMVSTDSLVSETIDLSRHRDAKGRIRWSVPAGKWRIIRYVCAPTGQPLALPSPNSKGLMLDHFSAEAQRHNMAYIFERLLPVTGSLKDRSLKYLYADSYEVNSAVWTPLFPEEFKKRNGYSVEEFLPVLDGFLVKNRMASDRFLFDFNKTLSDLIIENHYKLGRAICETHGIGFYAEAGGPGQPIHNVPFEDLKALGSLTVPRGEFWNKHPQLNLLQVIKGISSAAHIYDQTFVEAESFTSVWLWQEGPDELKPLADRAMCEGLNRFVYHTFPHTPRESGFPGWVYNFGTLINTTNGWWPKSQGFHEYLARCSYLLQQGHFRGDVAFYYGDEAPNFVSPKSILPTLGAGYDYDVINTEAIVHKMQVKDGKIYLPHGQYYEVLVLPHVRKMNLQVLEKLEKLVADGATIIGPRPESTYRFQDFETQDKQLKDLAHKMWGACDSIRIQEQTYGKGKIVWGKTVREVLRDKGVGPDLDVAAGGHLDFIHRSTGSEEIYFIRNVENKPLTLPVTFRVSGMVPELWDPNTGETITIRSYQAHAEGTQMPLSLEGYGSCFIVFRKAANPENVSALKLNDHDLFSTATNTVDLRHAGKGLLSTSAGTWHWTAGGRQNSRTVNLPAAIACEGPWDLRFDQAGATKGRMTRARFEKLSPLNESVDENIRYFSGRVAYHHTFDVAAAALDKGFTLLLELGAVKEIAEVFVNGRSMGTVWHAPFQVDITEAVQPGKNTLVVEVVNTINNGLIGDARLPESYRHMQSNINKLPNAWMNPFAEAPLKPAGLIGPVRIRFAATIIPAVE
ncbi:MAG TPA: glycosyl hydrolase, partial [Ohtaekwangia sp.]|nr:glycosyl hydrolase [Ohtaekwangia sp.]